MDAATEVTSVIDRLSCLFERFSVRARLAYTGTMCGVQRFDSDGIHGYVHVLRRGTLEITHRADSGLTPRLVVDVPSLIFYTRPTSHQFHNPPQEGSDFTCATVFFEGGLAHPLVAALPGLLVVPLAQVEGLAPALTLLFNETDRVRCGQRLLADRLFEIVLIQLLRWLLDRADEYGMHTGLMAGLSDPALARVLTAVHQAPGQNWTLATMAAQAGLSRTGFAARFKAVVGQTPLDYLTDWRISLAQAQLKAGTPIKLLAHELGYANPSALSRAFAARTGHAPRDWLKQSDKQP